MSAPTETPRPDQGATIPDEALELIAKWRALGLGLRDARGAVYVACAADLRRALLVTDADIAAASGRLDALYASKDAKGSSS